MSRMRLGIAVLVVAAAVAVVLLRSRHAQAPTTGMHAAGIDYRMAPLQSAMNAPEGSSPCDSAYNSVEALDEQSHKQGQATPWKQLADRGTFLARCAKLPMADQQCLVARYQAHHHDVCDPILQRYSGDNPLFEAAAAKP